jgi:hypothetical protein
MEFAPDTPPMHSALACARDVGSPQFVYAFVDPRLADLNGDPAFERLRPCLGTKLEPAM